MSADARQHPRARARIRVEYHFGSTTGVGYTDDISEGGIFLACDAMAEAGTRIYLRLYLPGNKRGEPLKIIGIVRRATEAGEGRSGMGIHFEVAYARTREALASFIEQIRAIQSGEIVLPESEARPDPAGSDEPGTGRAGGIVATLVLVGLALAVVYVLLSRL